MCKVERNLTCSPNMQVESIVSRLALMGRQSLVGVGRALEFCRRAILNASGLLVVAPRYEDSDRMVHCRLELLDEAGDRMDLGELLLKNGFASRQDLDWGRRMPR